MPRSPLRTNGRTIDATEAVKRMNKAIKRQTGARPEPYTPEPDPQKRTEPRREENVAIETLRQGTQSPGRRTPASKRPRRRNVMH
jgi:hypothetical protein